MPHDFADFAYHKWQSKSGRSSSRATYTYLESEGEKKRFFMKIKLSKKISRYISDMVINHNIELEK